MGWQGPMTYLHYQVWMEFFRIEALNGEPDLDMDGLVPEETQKRWHEKHNAARFQAAAEAVRRKEMT